MQYIESKKRLCRFFITVHRFFITIMVTLLTPDQIVKQRWMTDIEKKRITNAPSIEYITDFIAARYSATNAPPKIAPKSMGHRVVILNSATGSGKSTVVPVALYRKFLKDSKKTLVITQPRRLTTMDIPYQIAHYNTDIKIGKQIGYQTGTLSNRPIRGILFATVGVLLQILKNSTDEEIMSKYAFFIIDEAHERSADQDLALYYVKKFLEKNWHLPKCPLLILMSGTIAPAIFMKYFGVPKNNYIQVTGFSYPITEHFSKYDVNDYLAYACYTIQSIHTTTPSARDENKFADILVFLQGRAQINKLVEMIDRMNYDIFRKGKEYAQTALESKNIADFWVKGGADKKDTLPSYILAIPLMGEHIRQGSVEYMNLFSRIDNVEVEIRDENGAVVATASPTRRVVCATNSAETGLTIDTLGYCIDSGWLQDVQFSPVYGVSGLIERNVSRANSIQRRGRVGRKAPGNFYACYSQKTFEKLPAFNQSEIIREDISTLLLSIICADAESSLEELTKSEYENIVKDAGAGAGASGGTTHFATFLEFSQKWYVLKNTNEVAIDLIDLPQYPSADSIKCALERLHCLGFIDRKLAPTMFGYYANRFRRLKLEQIRVIFAGYHTGASVLDLITLIAMMTSGVIADRRRYKLRDPLMVGEEKVAAFHNAIRDENIDLLFVYSEFLGRIDKIVKYIEKGKKIPFGFIEEWCNENSLSYSNILQAVSLRDEIIEDMLSANLDPFYSSLDARPGTFNLVKLMQRDMTSALDEIKKIKKCIYEGYRFNLCVYDNTGGATKYVNASNGIPVVVKTKLVKDAPQYIVASDIMLAKNMSDPFIYDFYGNGITVLDGFVDVDETFLKSV